VIVTVEDAVPSAVTPVLGDAEMLEFATAGGPATKLTPPLDKSSGLVTVNVLVSA